MKDREAGPSAVDFEGAERHLRELRHQLDSGDLDEQTFRVQVARLLLQDGQGVFWMLDADEGTWFCNRGEGWEPGDPHAEPRSEVAEDAARSASSRGWLLGIIGVLLILVIAAGAVALGLVPLDIPWNPFRATPVLDIRAQVTIASPADGSQVAVGQVIAIESTVDAAPSLQEVARVALQVDGETVEVQPVQPEMQANQTSLPLSLLWRPDSAGEHQLAITVYSIQDQPLGTAAITLQVVEASVEPLPEPPCVPDAAFVGDVTIPPGEAFPPGARMDKVWQVRNSGPCAWGIGYELARLEGEGMGAPSAVAVPPTAAGELADLAVTSWAPVNTGTYANLWRLRSPEGVVFGPTLPLTIQVEVLATGGLPPAAPTGLQGTVSEDGQSVHLTWSDRSDNENAFRIHRGDAKANIGLAPANTESFVDEGVACGNTYRYWIVAFNAAGTSSVSRTIDVALPPCTPLDVPPTVTLTVVPTQVMVSESFTITFEAIDDQGVDLVVVWGEGTGDPALDEGQVFTCTEVICVGTWPVTWTQEVSVTLSLVAVALDAAGLQSEPARMLLPILLPEQPVATPTPQ